MKKLDVIKLSEQFLDSYFADNTDQLYQSIFGGITDSDDLQTATWKMVIDSTKYASKISAMTTLCLLIDLGIIDCDDSDTPIPPPMWGAIPQ